MRLAKPVVAALEMIAAGGAVLILSGSAFAADGSTSAATQKSAAPANSTSQQNADPSTDAAQAAPNSQQSSNSTTAKPGDETVRIQSTQSTELKAEQNKTTTSSSSQSQQGGGTATTVTNAEGSLQSAASQPTFQSTAKQGVVSTTKVLPADKVAADPAPQPLGQDQPKLPAGGQLAQAPLPVVVFRSSILPIQPTITSRATSAISDLAASMPTPPKPDKAPAPAKSSGALGKLTAVLASVVVPPSFSLPSLVPARMALELLLGLMLLVLIAVFVFSYGLWLRRGGICYRCAQ